MRRIHHKKLAEGAVFFLFAVVVAVLAVLGARTKQHALTVSYGATFSTVYAENLGLRWREVYTAMLDELQIKRVRLPVYWSELEPEEHVYHFDDLDWMLAEAAKRDVRVTLAIGRKVPRWPECYIPDWAEKMSRAEARQSLLDELENIVRRYDDQEVVERYQVENEPFYSFGECPTPDAELFDQEVALVKRLSNKPIQLTTSGENEFWLDTAIPANVLGVSMYRVTWNDVVGYSVYPLGPEYYAAKTLAVRPFTDKVIVSELQAEPWFTKGIEEQTPEELASQFTPTELSANVAFAKQAGFDEVDFWGVEYWYWMREHGQDGLWQAGVRLTTGD